MKLLRFAIALTAVTCLLVPVAAQNLPADLQRAIQREQTTGDLKAAIAEYQNIFERASSNPAVAARSLLRMAAAYETLGSSLAQATYERVLKEFASERVAAAEASRKLAALGGARSNSQLSTRLISGHYSKADTVTPDERFLTFTDWKTGDAVIRNLQTGEEQRVVRGRAEQGRDAGDCEDWAEKLTLSPDASQLAFAWFTSDAHELRVVSRDGRNLRTIVSRPNEFRNFNVKAWSRDGRSLLVTVQKPLPDRTVQLAWVDVSTGAIHSLQTFDPWQNAGYVNSIGTVSLSPNGRWIAYSMVEREGAPDRYVYVMAADGSSRSRLTSTAGISEKPVWTPDGASVLFMANWAASFGLWSVPVQDGRPSGSPSLLKADMGQADPIGMTASGSYVYNYAYDGGDRTFVARLTGMPASATAVSRVTQDFSGGFSKWSPDGRRIAFIRRHRSSSGAAIDELGVRVVATGEERLFRARAVQPQPPTWFHTKDAVLVRMLEADGTVPFYTIDLKSGLFTKTLPEHSEKYRRSAVVALSPDDRTLYLAADPRASRDVSLDDLIAVDLASGAERLVLSLPPTPTRRVGASIGLDLSPDGRTLVVVSRPGIRGTPPEFSDDTVLFTVGVDGQGFRQVYAPFSNAHDAKVAWGRDGQEIFFVHSSVDPYRRFNWQIAKIAASGGTPVATGFDLIAFLPDPAHVSPTNTDPRFDRLNGSQFRTIDLSPDGSQLLFSTNVNPKYEVWALDKVIGAVR